MATSGRVGWLVLACGGWMAAQPIAAGAAVLFSDGFEGVTLAANTDTKTVPGWTFLSTATGGTTDPAVSATWSGIYNPTGSGRFTSTNPLAAPAGGKNYLYVSGSNNRAVRGGGALQAGVTYTLALAVGYDTALGLAENKQWVMELWAGAVGPAGTKLASLDGTAITIPTGGWLGESLTYTATAATEGKTLYVALGSLNGVTTYNPGNFDTVILSNNSVAVPAPLPQAAFGLGLLALGLLHRRAARPGAD